MAGESFEAIFVEALKKLDDAYCAGAWRYGKARFPSTWNEIRKIEDEINRIWKAGIVDERTVWEFRYLVKRWYLLNLRILEYFKKTTTQREWKQKDEKYSKTGTDSLF